MPELVQCEGETADSIKSYIAASHLIICAEIRSILYDLSKQLATLQDEFYNNVDAGPAILIHEECVKQVKEICSTQCVSVDNVAQAISNTL